VRSGAAERSASPPEDARASSLGASGVLVVNVSRDTTAQNETPLATNPVNPDNLTTGNNDWNYNDGCGVNASFDGGRTWTPALPNGFVPGITRYTNDPAVSGTGAYDYGGDPAVAFGPDGTASFACFGYQSTSPYGVALFLSRSDNGGRSWLAFGVPSGNSIRPFIGDYDGIVSQPSSVGITWTGPGKTYGTLPTNLEVYFASVKLQ